MMTDYSILTELMKLLAYMTINDQMAGFLCKYGKVDGFTFN